MFNKEILEFDSLIYKYNYIQLINLQQEINKIHNLTVQIMNQETDTLKKADYEKEISIIQANHIIINLAISYMEAYAVRETEYGELSLN